MSSLTGAVFQILQITKNSSSSGFQGRRTTNIGDLAGLISLERPDAVDVLKKANEGLLELWKYRGGATPTRYRPDVDTDDEFFYTGKFQIRITTDGKFALDAAPKPEPPKAKIGF